MRSDIQQVLTAAGYPSPTTYFDGSNLYIDSYNIAVPGGSRTATLLVRYNFATSFTSTTWCSVAVVDSTQYNSGTGVVTGGAPFQGIGTLSNSTSVNTTNIEFISYTPSATDGNRFRFVVLAGVGSTASTNLILGMWFPYIEESTLVIPANHTMALLVYGNQSNWTLFEGFLTTLNPFQGATLTEAGTRVENAHETLSGFDSVIQRQILFPLPIRYTGNGTPKPWFLGNLGNDVAYMASNGLDSLVETNDNKWQVISASGTAGAIALRIAD